MTQSSKHRINNLKLLAPFLKPYRKEIICALIALLVTTFLVLFFGRAIKYFIDYGFVEKNSINLTIAFLIFVSAILAMAVAGYYRSFLVNSVAEKVIADIRKKVFSHILHVSSEFFEITKSGDIVSRLTVDTTSLQNVISNSASFFLRNLLLFIGGIFFIFITSAKLSVISINLILLATLPILIFGKQVKKMATKTQESLALVGSHIEESVSGIRTIQSYCCEEKESRNFSNFVNNSLSISLSKIRAKSLMIASVITLAFGAIAIVLWVGGNDVIDNTITPGELSSFIFYSIITATSLVSLSQIAGQLQTASASASRIFELMQIESPVAEIAYPTPFPNTKEINIKIQNVDFHYPSHPDKIILENFSLDIKPGEKIAIVGASGSGKTTILKLLLRFYDIDFGSIRLNDNDIKLLSFSDLRKNFSYISQQCFIFSGTVFENIAYVGDSVTENKVKELIFGHSAFDFINSFPQGMHSLIGEKGIKLSGGERQRIALARALLKESPVLLLDEATSSLDNRNEQSIMRTISELAHDRTVITIAHRLSTVINSDRIIFLNNGRIVESGTHKELMEQNGFYKAMYEAEDKKRA